MVICVGMVMEYRFGLGCVDWSIGAFGMRVMTNFFSYGVDEDSCFLIRYEKWLKRVISAGIVCLMCALVCLNLAFAASDLSQPIKNGEDYISLERVDMSSTSNMPEIWMFFSYGCPLCRLIDPLFEQWIIAHPKAKVHRVPVVFREEWYSYAVGFHAMRFLPKSYQTIDLKKMHQECFEAIQVRREDLTTSAGFINFFVRQGVVREDAKCAMGFTPGIAKSMNEDEEWLKQFKIHLVPALVFNKQYMITGVTAKGNPQRFIDILDALYAQNVVQNKMLKTS